MYNIQYTYMYMFQVVCKKYVDIDLGIGSVMWYVPISMVHFSSDGCCLSVSLTVVEWKITLVYQTGNMLFKSQV